MRVSKWVVTNCDRTFAPFDICPPLETCLESYHRGHLSPWLGSMFGIIGYRVICREAAVTICCSFIIFSDRTSVQGAAIGRVRLCVRLFSL